MCSEVELDQLDECLSWIEHERDLAVRYKFDPETDLVIPVEPRRSCLRTKIITVPPAKPVELTFDDIEEQIADAYVGLIDDRGGES